MTTISQLTKRLESLNLRAQVPVIIDNTKSEIVVSVKEQLHSGIDGTGKSIQPKYRSNSYAYRKQQINPKPGFGVPDLKITGKFYNSISVLVDNTSFTINSSDTKAPKLETKYGEDILRMSPTSVTNYAQGKFFQELKKYIIGKTGLQFR